MDVEFSLILGIALPEDGIALPEDWSLLHEIQEGNYSKVINSDCADKILNVKANKDQIHSIEDLSKRIESQSERYINDSTSEEDKLRRELDVLALGVGFLSVYLQSSWTGPKFEDALYDELDSSIRKSTLKFLSEDDEDVYHLMPQPLFLAIAKMILVDNSSLLKDLNTSPWWKFRCSFIQQRVLANPTQTLFDIILECIDEARTRLPALNDDNRDLHVKLDLEEGLVHSFHRQDLKAYTSFTSASTTSNLKWSMSGALGKRTKFQSFDVAQLVVVAESAPRNTSNKMLSKEDVSNLPDTLALNDDTLLEKISFTKMEDATKKDVSKQGSLRIMDQCILLAFCLNVKNTNPTHGLTEEEMVPYVTRVLENPNNWMVHTMGLLLRSRLESQKSRTVERSCLQIQALVDQIPIKEPSPAERLLHFYDLLVPSKWDLERELGERLISLGVMRSAMEIYERLELWQDVISCLMSLGQDKQAEELVNKRLAETPKSPLLLCILGDLKKDPSYWQQAWVASNYRYARAMRSLGSFHFTRKAYAESVACYHRALAINPLFENSWFVMGCAAMRIDEWDTAAKAFNRCINIDFENGEAWTNLASVYIKQGRKRDAWRAQREALKQNFESYRMWENFMVFSIDLGEFDEAIQALKQIVELRWKQVVGSGNALGDEEKIVDIEVLNILVGVVVHETPDARGVPASRLAPRMESLIEDICSKIATSSSIFRAAANFYQSQHEIRRSLEYRTKGYRVGLNHPRLTLDEHVFLEAATSAMDLVDALETYGPQAVSDGSDEVYVKDWKYQAKMTLRTLVGRTRDVFENQEKHILMREKLETLK
ncbi:hypothetical protein SmJEL517_g02337 [Synchytrium microbalum]|uniref:Uncharacterized protein n=1 Tax=Synchytrium microbalum TaxID=1806994 RepID=A0A507CBH2_9FUNG|nr:uncharacterized protein SmJEL517_g02337 [Synchytrium microbalum]TPX35304.1 hypothetical protein SmJEL517_g02337 [Synchytrium microbalum]